MFSRTLQTGKMRNKSKTPQKPQTDSDETTWTKMLQEVKRDEKWRNAIAEELNCMEKKVKYKIIEKFQKILTSSISNSLVEIDKVKESITFHYTANTFTFFEKISTVFQCNLIVNKLSVSSDVNYLKNCKIHLTEDSILCKIKDTKVDKHKT